MGCGSEENTAHHTMRHSLTCSDRSGIDIATPSGTLWIEMATVSEHREDGHGDAEHADCLRLGQAEFAERDADGDAPRESCGSSTREG